MTEINFLSELNFYEVFHNILAQFPGIKALLLKFKEEIIFYKAQQMKRAKLLLLKLNDKINSFKKNLVFIFNQPCFFR